MVIKRLGVHTPLGYRLVSVVALLIFFALSLHTARSKSITNDEPVHILRGYTLWQTGNLRFQFQHTPLSHRLIGLLLGTEPTLPDITRLPEWQIGDQLRLAQELLWDNNQNTDLPRVLFLSRVPIIWLTLLLGVLLICWVRIWQGKTAVIVIALLFAFSPNLLGTASLATTDATITVTYFAAIFSLWHYQQKPSKARWFLTSCCLGLALSAKFTGALIVPITLLLILSRWRPGQPFWPLVWQWLSLLPLAGFILWGMYGFELRPILELPFAIPAATYFDSLLNVQGHFDAGHRSFLLGELSSDGWWYYFIVVFFIKTPITTLCLFFVAILILLKQWRGLLKIVYLWLPALALFLIASYSGLNIGYRHILPILPFVWMLCVLTVWWSHKYWRWVGGVLVLWYVVGSLNQQPHYLAYFNELVGGSAQGYRYLGDSNLDWGQDLNLLTTFVQQSSEKVYLSYSGFPRLAAYGLDDFSLEAGVNFAPANPTNGRYAISANHLHGVTLAEPDSFAWFRQQTPIDHLGYSILIYDIPAVATGDWVAYCTKPAPMLEQAQALQLLGQQEARHVYFDCQTSWVFPDNGTPGWYILPSQIDEERLIEPLWQGLRLVYRHRAWTTPAYEVYYWAGHPNLASTLMQSGSEVTLSDGTAVERPLSVSDSIQFLGYWHTDATWATIWQARGTPPPLLSVLGHLYGETEVPQIADGLGYSSEQWRDGDIVIQYHAFEETEATRYLATGVYNFASGERVSIAGQEAMTIHLSP